MSLAPSYHELLLEFQNKQAPPQGKLLKINGISEDKRAYNPTIIQENGTNYLVARVESKTSDWVKPESYDPTAIFFKKDSDGTWNPDPEIKPFYQTEDPFATWIEDQDGSPLLIFGGVQIDRSTPRLSYFTSFFKGKSIKTLERQPFAKIAHMKDIRLVQRKSNKQIAVCARPLIYGDNTGRIGMFSINSIDELNTDKAFSSCIYVSQVAEDTWIGTNKLYLLSDSKTQKEEIGVLCHVAHLDQDKTQHYSSAVFKYDPDDPCEHDLPRMRPKIIATRSNFEQGPSKTPQLQDVLFSAGLEHQQDGMVKLYAGLSDAAIGTIILPDPFL